ncbi:hypothetical protein [Duganella sp. BuS-21]|uniref:hypothetical protein n=1 Tax=Duganella sp. BuS-21 TaxID=2943848 RepID=UPI0035A696F3
MSAVLSASLIALAAIFIDSADDDGGVPALADLHADSRAFGEEQLLPLIAAYRHGVGAVLCDPELNGFDERFAR